MRLRNWISAGLSRAALVHAARTTVAATLSLAIAEGLRLPEPQWAAISTMVVTQSTLGAAWTISGQRFAGTVLGASAGALLAAHIPPGILAFTIAVFGLGLLCALLHLDRAAYRFAGITVTIVMLAGNGEPAWITATHRFLEVSLGIGVGLAMTAMWPQTTTKAPGC